MRSLFVFEFLCDCMLLYCRRNESYSCPFLNNNIQTHHKTKTISITTLRTTTRTNIRHNHTLQLTDYTDNIKNLHKRIWIINNKYLLWCYSTMTCIMEEDDNIEPFSEVELLPLISPWISIMILLLLSWLLSSHFRSNCSLMNCRTAAISSGCEEWPMPGIVIN